MVFKMQNNHIGFIGGGNMARSLVGGLIKAGVQTTNISIADPVKSIRQQLGQDFGVTVSAHNNVVARKADILVLSVKPQVLAEAISSISASILGRSILIISIAAGIRMRSLERWIGDAHAIVRVMPNTPALIGSGISALIANTRVSNQGKKDADLILSTAGTTVWLENESLLDTVTAVSGSGPAYFFYLMEAIEAAAISEGLDPETARILVTQTALGASKLAMVSNESLTTLRERVTSPGGTTEAALKQMQAGAVFESLQDAVHAAKRRSHELAFILDEDLDESDDVISF